MKRLLYHHKETEWRTVKTETNKINQVLPYISTNNITELNKRIYAEGKIVCEKLGIPSKSMKKESKPGWEIRLETDIKISTKTGQNDKTKKRRWNMLKQKKEKATRRKITVQLEEINQKVLAKEGRLKRYRQSVKQYRQNRTFQNNERKFYQQLGGDDAKNTNNRMQKKPNDFGLDMATKKYNGKAEWRNTMTKELEGLEVGLKVEIHIDLLKMTLKKYQTGKCQAMMECTVPGSRNSLLFTTD